MAKKKKVITLHGCDIAGQYFTNTYVCDADKFEETFLAVQAFCTEYYDYEIADAVEYDDEELQENLAYIKKFNCAYL